MLFSSGVETSLTTYPPVQSAGSRMMWFSPRKAFRVGTVQGPQWDRDSIGMYSFAANYNTVAYGQHSVAFGYNSTARGLASAVFGQNTHASGEASHATGVQSLAIGGGSVAMGIYPIAKGHASTALGFTTNQNPNLTFCYGTDFTGPQTKMVLDSSGRLGINELTPNAHLHIVRNGSTGGPFFSSAIAIFESNEDGYLQLSNENTDETGILSGNMSTSIRSGIIFRADSSIQFRAGGNTTRMVISKIGNVGIGTSTPSALLHVNGTSRFGVNGSVINEIIKATVNANVPSIAANGGTVTQLFIVNNVALTSAVNVSPGSNLAGGIVIASARVSTANTVEVRFVNTTSSSIDPDAMDFHFVVIR